uniref:Ribosomal protein s8 n=1 Tax=Prototheca stagnorum TaxID=215448 RepID=A0A2Z6BEM4_9CHLO|nr:ribosomal protein s8 [Prototheca stagnorum]BBD20175.1 ribosomal protein s8 [Prototheca stagnorum]
MRIAYKNNSVINMITNIRNALLLHKNSVLVPDTQIIRQIATILIKNGLLVKYSSIQNGKKKKLLFILKYFDKINYDIIESRSAILTIKPHLLEEKKGVTLNEISKNKYLGEFLILSTSKGLLTREEAIAKCVGGIVVLRIT